MGWHGTDSNYPILQLESSVVVWDPRNCQIDSRQTEPLAEILGTSAEIVELPDRFSSTAITYETLLDGQFAKDFSFPHPLCPVGQLSCWDDVGSLELLD